MDTADYELLTTAVDRAAAIAVSKFPAHHDIEDVKQELWVWIVEKKNTVSELLEKSEGSDQLLVDLMTKVAMTVLKKEDAATYGYDEEDVFNYSVDLIKSILEVVFIHEDWQSLAQVIGDGLPRAKSEPATSGNNLASYADVSRAITSLPEDLYNVLVWRYKYNYTFEQIGQEIGLTKQTAANQHRAAVNAIQQFLGKKDLSEFRRGYDERIEPYGNASAQSRVERDWDG